MTEMGIAMRIYLCQDSFESIATAVYDAWDSGLGHENVKIQLETELNLELFCEYVKVATDPKKVEKVVRSIRKKLSEEVFEYVYKAALSCSERKADIIYRFLVKAFKRGRKILMEHADSAVCDIFELVRTVSNEVHLLLGFIRFQEVENGILLAKIKPKSKALTLVSPHFANRLSGENWIIFDEAHHEAVFHQKNGEWFLTNEVGEELSQINFSEKNGLYEDLWKLFFNTIAIQERRNKNLQRQLLPLRYREDMTEFNEKSSKSSVSDKENEMKLTTNALADLKRK